MKAGKDYIGAGGGVLILNKKEECLLMKRGKNSKNEAGWWCKPGGAIDWGEKAEDAMKREIREELGIEIDIWGYLPHTDHVIKKDNQHWLAVNYVASIKKGEPKNMEPDKHDEIRWFSLDELPRKTTKTTREPVRDFLNKKIIKLK